LRPGARTQCEWPVLGILSSGKQCLKLAANRLMSHQLPDTSHADRRGVDKGRFPIQLHRLSREWNEVMIAELAAAPAMQWGAVRRRRVMRPTRPACYSSEDRDTEELYGRHGVYAASKRQLGAREIRGFGLPR